MNQQSNLRKKHARSFDEKKEKSAGCSIICGRAGSVLLVIIVTMVILASLSAAILPTLFTSEMGQVSASQAMKAYYLAEAGGRYTLPRLQGITTGTHKFKFNNGDTFFEIEKLSNAEFTSTGLINEGSTLESQVSITYKIKSIFDYGLFGGEGLTVGNNAVVDGNVGTNGDNLDGISGNAAVNGEQEVSVDKDMTPVDLPAGAASWTDKTSELGIGNMPNGASVNLGAGEYYASDIDISNNSTVNITGDVVIYVNGTTDASNNSTLNINPGASLTIYAAGDVDLSNNSMVNPDETPSSFVIYGIAGCDNIWLSNNSDTYGAIYAPTADIHTGNNADVYGSLVGETITINSNAYVSYDEDLINLNIDNSDVEQYFAEN